MIFHEDLDFFKLSTTYVTLFTWEKNRRPLWAIGIPEGHRSIHRAPICHLKRHVYATLHTISRMWARSLDPYNFVVCAPCSRLLLFFHKFPRFKSLSFDWKLSASKKYWHINLLISCLVLGFIFLAQTFFKLYFLKAKHFSKCELLNSKIWTIF
jgi:hypothetical protein